MLIFLQIKKKKDGDVETQVHHDPFINNSQRGIELRCIFWGAPSQGFQSYSEPMSPFPETIFLRLGSHGIYSSGNFPFLSSEEIQSERRLMHSREIQIMAETCQDPGADVMLLVIRWDKQTRAYMSGNSYPLS